MTKLYRKYDIALSLTGIVWCVFCVLLIATGETADGTVTGLTPISVVTTPGWARFPLAVSVYLALMVPLSVILRRAAEREHRRTLSLLLDSCDPDSFLKEYEKLLHNSIHMRFMTYREYAFGLYCAGKYSDAVRNIGYLLEDPEFTRVTGARRCFVYLYAYIIYCAAGDEVKAQEMLSGYASVMNTVRKKERGEVERLAETVKNRENIRRGYIADAERFFSEQKCTCRLWETFRQNDLAAVYTLAGRPEEAAECYNAVIAAGGKTAVAARARRLKAELAND